MDWKTLDRLEYTKILDLLASHASSDRGKAICLNLRPVTVLSEVNAAQEETAAALDRIIKKGRFTFGGYDSAEDAGSVMENAVNRLNVGAVLGSAELLCVCRLCEIAARAKAYGRRDIPDDEGDCLDPYFAQLSPLSSLSARIRQCILNEDEISDDASPNLRHIRRSIRQIHDKVRQTLNGLITGSLRAYLQDPIITMRGDRYCIPVKSEYRGQVNGLIHDQSSTGSTLFMEPMAVVRLNNDLKELLVKEQEEIQVILADLSGMAAESMEEIRVNMQVLGELDFIFAKGSLALSMNASRPLFNTKGFINIIKGRHPLLDKDKVVPVTISLGGKYHVLIVTGPNTGGKTVSVKTAGLFTLMGQAGLHIPANERSELAVFDNVFADIGDEQSIAQSLSTFSAHMSNIISFLKQADGNSLLLFDELCAGTDPTEGAALATAILSHLLSRGIRTMATTHYSELKVFAMSASGVENACCEFDVETLRPTYRLITGIPGKSNAFAISSKLGLPDSIIEDAGKHLSKQEISFESLLADLENRRLAIENEHAEVVAIREEAEALKSEYESRKRQLNERKEQILGDAKAKAAAMLREAKDVADDTIRQFRKFGKENISIADMEKEREKLRRKLEMTGSGDGFSAKKPHRSHRPDEFHPGDSVRVHSLNLNGIVRSLPDADGNLYVQMGILRSKVNISDLSILSEPPLTLQKNGSSSGKIKMQKSMTVSPEIMLLGKTVDEALAVLDKYLDDACLSGLTQVRIVHGKGSGALRAAVHGYLKRSKHVKSFRLGAFGEGDAGVTVAELQ